MDKNLIIADEQYQSLINEIGSVLLNARNKISREVNITMVDAYWNIGRYIVEYEQQGKERAEYGTNLLNRLSKDLTRLYGKGFGKSNLIYIRKLYQSFPISGTRYLNWMTDWKGRFTSRSARSSIGASGSLNGRWTVCFSIALH